jgi:hypothetical protein
MKLWLGDLNIRDNLGVVLINGRLILTTLEVQDLPINNDRAISESIIKRS